MKTQIQNTIKAREDKIKSLYELIAKEKRQFNESEVKELSRLHRLNKNEKIKLEKVTFFSKQKKDNIQAIEIAKKQAAAAEKEAAEKEAKKQEKLQARLNKIGDRKTNALEKTLAENKAKAKAKGPKKQ